MRSSPKRIHPLVLASVSWAVLVIATTLASSEVASQRVRSDEVDRIYRNWHETIDRKRQESMIQPTPTVFDKSKYFPSVEESAGSFIIINGKKVFTRSDPTPTPETSADVSAATAAVLDGTRAPAVPAAVPTPTPGLVSIKVSRVVDGKIITEEIIVTPTPASANEVSDTTAQTVSKPQPAGMGEIRDLLKKSANPMGRRPHLQQKQIAQILQEFMKARKEKKDFDAMIPRNQADAIQSSLIRLASMAQGGSLQPAMAKLIHAALFQGQQPAPRGAAPRVPPSQSTSPPPAPAAPAAETNEPEEVPAEPEPEEAETVEYYEVDVFYDEEGRAYYFDENGNAYYFEDE